MYSFSRPDHLRRHVQDCHLRYLDPDALLWCPHPSCSDVLDGVKDFQEHALLVYNVFSVDYKVSNFTLHIWCTRYLDMTPPRHLRLHVGSSPMKPKTMVERIAQFMAPVC
ncbi:hypothetical protein ACJ73_06826 [Blastomyces percursus]|uniref:C2H2-type domain-containing protein n=1 Tax=Blastomyces percursus TaxID=1658174 RepID=A0A1J9R028_9EURO|nr:hypothetical protein ACJ73_06826 [Blastomyces percursus]